MKPTGVYYCSRNNSTCFTQCCHTAIRDAEGYCPKCGNPCPYTPRERHEQGMRSIYTSEQLKEIRSRYGKHHD